MEGRTYTYGHLASTESHARHMVFATCRLSPSSLQTPSNALPQQYAPLRQPPRHYALCPPPSPSPLADLPAPAPRSPPQDAPSHQQQSPGLLRHLAVPAVRIRIRQRSAIGLPLRRVMRECPTTGQCLGDRRRQGGLCGPPVVTFQEDQEEGDRQLLGREGWSTDGAAAAPAAAPAY